MKILAGLLLAVASVLYGQVATLTAGSIVGAPGETVAVPLTLGGSQQPAAIQWTVVYDPAQIAGLSAAAGPMALAAEKAIYCNPATTTVYVCVLAGLSGAGLNSNTMADGAVAILNVTLATNSNGPATIALTNTLAASPAGSAISVNGIAGAITGGITASMQLNAVANAAGFLNQAVSPGEIVSIFGTALGPTTPASLTLDKNGNVSTSLGGVQVNFNGVPAPLTYVSNNQVNVVVPYEMAGLSTLFLQVQYLGQVSNSFSLPSANTAPVLFTANQSGKGPVAGLNQDNSYNGPSNPAPKGSVVALFMTGEGQTSPPGVTGKVTTLSPTTPLTPQPVLPVSVLIDGQPAQIAFYGEAPALVSGVMQVNVAIPANAPSGNLPIQVLVGGNISQNGVTVSVQ